MEKANQPPFSTAILRIAVSFYMETPSSEKYATFIQDSHLQHGDIRNADIMHALWLTSYLTNCLLSFRTEHELVSLVSS